MAGKINREWLENARLREVEGESIEELFAAELQVEPVGIDGEGAVWAVDHWLSQETIDETCKAIHADLWSTHQGRQSGPIEGD